MFRFTIILCRAIPFIHNNIRFHLILVTNVRDNDKNIIIIAQVSSLAASQYKMHERS